MASRINRKFINISFACDGFSRGNNVTKTNGIQYIVAESPIEAFAGAQKNQIAKYYSTSNEWKFFDPEDCSVIIDKKNQAIYRYRSDTNNWVFVSYIGEDDQLAIANNNLMYPYPVTFAHVVDNYHQYNPVKNSIHGNFNFNLQILYLYTIDSGLKHLKLLDKSTGKFYQVKPNGEVVNIPLPGIPNYYDKLDDNLLSNFAPMYVIDYITTKAYKITYNNNKVIITSEDQDTTIPKVRACKFFLQSYTFETTNKLIHNSSMLDKDSMYYVYMTSLYPLKYINVPVTLNPDNFLKYASRNTVGFIRKDPVCSNIMYTKKSDQEHSNMCIPLSMRSIRAQFTQDQITNKKIVIKFDKATNPWYNPIGIANVSLNVRFSVGDIIHPY